VLTQSYPDLSGPYANLGILYRNANQLAEAEAAMAKATERAPWDAQTWTEYGSRCARPASSRGALPYEKAIARILPTRRRTAISGVCSTCSSMIRDARRPSSRPTRRSRTKTSR
jgi:hypothetical protein